MYNGPTQPSFHPPAATIPGWTQPNANDIVIDDRYAVMSLETFNQLKDYSRSYPTGVSFGKMWKCAKYDRSTWWLLWYHETNNPTMAGTAVREILIV